MNIANLLLRAGLAAGDRPAITVGTRRYATYHQLAHRVAVMAGSMRRILTLNPGDRVALFMKNSARYIEILFACWQAGLTAVPINAKLAPQEVNFVLDNSGTKVCFVTEDLKALIGPFAENINQLQAVIPVDSKRYLALMQGAPMAVTHRAPADTAWLFYTSGTTGRPKGAMLSHRSLLAMTAGYFIDVDHIDRGDSIIHAAPMSHGSGLYIIPHVAAAANQVIPESSGFDPEEILHLIEAHGGVTLFAAPTMLNRLVRNFIWSESDVRNLKTIVYGGGPMYLSDCKRALGCFGGKLVQIYGQGESPMTITTLSKAHHNDVAHPRYEQRLASVGTGQAIIEIRIADVADNPMPTNEVGEVLVRGDSLMTGYWNDPEATSHTLRNNWLHTGDLGSQDENGFLTLRDRSKDLIITGGSNVYPREVEEALLKHPAVAEVAVVGLPDPEWGEKVVAFVVTQPNRAISQHELDNVCLEHIARFKRPRVYRFVQTLPKNSYGKVLKTSLRDML